MENEAIEQEEGAAEEQQIEQAQQTGISDEKLKEILEERDKKWQSRFDKVLSEKKTEEQKAMTVEQRMAKLEQEREQERLTWARKEAKAKAQIDDELEAAITAYASSDPEQIAEGAEQLKQLVDNKIAEYTKRIDELEKQVKYAGKPPSGGGTGDAKIMSVTDFNGLSPKEQSAFMKGGGTLQGE